MSTRTIAMTDELYDYLLKTSLREAPVLRQLRDETKNHPRASMQISPEQGQFMQLLVQLMQAKKYLEIGVFTGYSSLAVALALPEDGRIVACDVSEEFTAIARRYWAEAGVANKIDLRLAPALETLDSLIADGWSNTFDFAFIDADKANYAAYYERALTLMRPGGLIGFDNTLWAGAVADPTFQDSDTIALRRLNETLHTDERVTISMLPIGDGLTLALKR
jgi:predicted O-methyltransferase YrrM